MARNIEDFLRQAAAKRRGVEIGGVEIGEEEVVYAEAVERKLPRASLQANHPTQLDPMSTDDVTEHGEHFSDKMEKADDEREARMHRKFDQQVGDLKESASVHTEVKAEMGLGLASEIMEMLSQPKSVRQAIILSEVLERPEHRW